MRPMNASRAIDVRQQPYLPTVNDLLREYQKEQLPHLAATTQRQIQVIHRRFAKDLGKIALAELTPERLRKWRDTLSNHYAPGTVRRYMHLFSATLTMGVRDYEWLARNPMSQVKPPPAPDTIGRCLTPEERDRLLAACQQSRSPQLYLFVVLALSTGARKNELLTLRWTLVDLDRGMLRFPRTKNYQPRVVPLTGLGLVLLRQYAETAAGRGWVFPGRGAAPISFDHPFKAAVKKAGLGKFRIHDLRHTFATRLVMSGASLTEAAELLGHRQMRMVQRYQHLTISHLSGVAAKMTAEFLPER